MTGIEMYIAWLDSIKDGPDQTARDRLAAHLVECEDAKSILRAKGHGKVFMTIDEVARVVPDAMKGK